MMPGLRIAVGCAGAVTIALLAHRARSLSASGAVAAVIAGTAAAAAGWHWAVLLITYFVSAAALSRVGRRRKLDLAGSMVAKAGPRDAAQVTSNGLPFVVAALVVACTGDASPAWMAVGAGSLAASAADTWATEVGTLVGRTPRSVLTGRQLVVGQSGGVTLPGTIASIAGAMFIAGCALLLGWPANLAVPILAGGIAGSLADSLAGALVQRRSWCDACEEATEMRVHTCGGTTRRIGGLAFIENDAVNLLATVIGALVAGLLAMRTP
jgi:uncharacterized protein (TIGR00297 family)